VCAAMLARIVRSVGESGTTRLPGIGVSVPISEVRGLVPSGELKIL